MSVSPPSLRPNLALAVISPFTPLSLLSQWSEPIEALVIAPEGHQTSQHDLRNVEKARVKVVKTYASPLRIGSTSTFSILAGVDETPL
jgi:hypothetical protein